jgi:hypothetical protein
MSLFRAGCKGGVPSSQGRPPPPPAVPPPAPKRGCTAPDKLVVQLSDDDDEAAPAAGATTVIPSNVSHMYTTGAAPRQGDVAQTSVSRIEVKSAMQDTLRAQGCFMAESQSFRHLYLVGVGAARSG